MSDLMETESKHEEIIPADDDCQNISDTLFFISTDDLDSSVILHHRGHYPQSVFYLQQSVEKAVKSIGLLFGVISEKDLLKNVGHKPLEIYKKPVNKFSEDLMSLNKNLEFYPEFKNILDSSGIDTDKFVLAIKKGKHEFNHYISNIASYNLTKEEVEEYISKMENINRYVKKSINIIGEREITDEVFDEIKDQIGSSFEKLLESSDITDESKEQILSELKSQYESFFPEKEFFQYFMYIIIHVMGIGVNLFYLSVITSLHSSKSRYPEKNFNPLTFYTPECPLIEKMPEIQNLTRHTLEEIDLLYDLMNNPPEFPNDTQEYSQITAENPGDEIRNEQ